VFGQESRSNHKQFLLRRIAWRLQANAEGGLSERARLRAAALSEEADLRIRAPESFLKALANPGGREPRDSRLPAPGQSLSREFRGQTVSMEVLKTGFRCQERVYKSLSAVARHVTGVQRNGFSFFGHALRESAGSAQTGSDRTGGRGRDLSDVNGNVSVGEVTESRGETDR
jgi:hypothetical protein